MNKKKSLFSRYAGRLCMLVVLAMFVSLLLGCSNVYYAAWEKVGKHKRDLLRDNIEAVQKEQQEAGEQFKDALTRLKELTGFKGGDLEDAYNKLRDDYEKCEKKAEAVKRRIRKIDSIASDLFDEWSSEIDSMSSPQLKRKSREKLAITKKRYARLYRAMKKTEKRLPPVLTQLRDNVLYLKHNLNARAIAGLQAEVSSIELDVDRLVKDLQASIKEAEEFIKTMPE